MKISGKIYLFLLCAGLISVLVLSGCGVQKKTDKEEETVVLEVYTWKDEENYMGILADSFMESHEGIEVNMHYLPTEIYEQQLLVLFEEGKQIDCILSPFPAQASKFVDRGMIRNIEKDIKSAEDKYITEYYPNWFYEDARCESYMLPYRSGKYVVYYNKTLFDKMGIPYPQEGWTWSDYADIATQLTQTVDGREIFGSLSFSADNIWWAVPARSAGAVNPLNPEELELFKKAAEWSYDLTYNKKAQRSYHEQVGDSASGYDGQFLAGNVGMYFSGEWSVLNLNQQMDKMDEPFEYDIAPLPTWEGEERYSYIGTAVATVTSSTEYPEEAFSFVQYVAGKEGAEVLASCGVIPALQEESLKELFSETVQIPEHVEYFFTEENTVTNPESAEASETLSIMKDEVEKYLLQNQSLEDTFSIITEKIRGKK